jgi:hypothetical protein
MKIAIITASLLFLVGCATSNAPAIDVAGAQATAQAAAQQAQFAANAATAQAGQATAQAVEVAMGTAIASTAVAATATAGYEATAGNLAFQATSQAIAANATGAAIAAIGTGTAVAQAAQLESYLIADEATRIAQVREAERIANQRAQFWNAAMPWIIGAVTLALVTLIATIAHAYWRRSQVNIINDENNRPQLIIYGGEARALPSPRQPLALPAPREDAIARPIPLPSLSAGHVLIAGETGSGKSTAMLAVLGARQNVIVLDPHDAPGIWGNARVIGGGRDFDAIHDYMEHMRRLLMTRYTQRSQGRDTFDSLTVATDEMPAIVAALGRQVDATWREWLREGRKVGLFFVVSTQSTRVTTLGIKGEGDLLENFHYVLELGKLAMNDYPGLVHGMERPAVIRSLDGTYPVIIPHVPMARQQAPAPMFTAPEPAVQLSNSYPDPRQMDDATRQRILRLSRELDSQAAIERAVFGYAGGAAYHAVKEVLSNATTTGVIA